MNIFKDWTDEHTSVFRKDIMTVRHKLEDTGLFTDDALADLLDKHPSEKLDVCTMGHDHPLYPNKFRTGDFRDCDGKTLIEAAKAGAIWMNVRQAMNVHPEYKSVLQCCAASAVWREVALVVCRQAREIHQICRRTRPAQNQRL